MLTRIVVVVDVDTAVESSSSHRVMERQSHHACYVTTQDINKKHGGLNTDLRKEKTNITLSIK